MVRSLIPVLTIQDIQRLDIKNVLSVFAVKVKKVFQISELKHDLLCLVTYVKKELDAFNF